MGIGLISILAMKFDRMIFNCKKISFSGMNEKEGGKEGRKEGRKEGSVQSRKVEQKQHDQRK